jgi:hypothetical protein
VPPRAAQRLAVLPSSARVRLSDGRPAVTERGPNLNGLGKLFVSRSQPHYGTMTQALVMLVVAIFALKLVVDIIRVA